MNPLPGVDLKDLAFATQLDSSVHQRRVGFVFQESRLFPHMKVVDALTYGQKRSTRTQSTSDWAGTIDLLGIDRLLERRPSQLSGGERQRVGIAQAILHEPQVLVLDEPTIGIDPIQVVETRKLIQELGRDQTVVLSSHILPEVSMICDRVLIISEGRIVAEDTPKNLAERLQGVDRLEVEVGGPAAEVLPVLKGIKGVNNVAHVNENGRHTYTIQAQSGQDLRDEISQAVISNGWSLRGLQMVGMSLEEIFLRLTTHEEL